MTAVRGGGGLADLIKGDGAVLLQGPAERHLARDGVDVEQVLSCTGAPAVGIAHNVVGRLHTAVCSGELGTLSA